MDDTSRAQRLAALDRANAARTARARLKEKVAADPTWSVLIDVVCGAANVELVARMKVAELLVMAPGIGPAKARRILRATAGGNYSGIVFGWLGEARRAALLFELDRAKRSLTPCTLNRIAANADARTHRTRTVYRRQTA